MDHVANYPAAAGSGGAFGLHDGSGAEVGCQGSDQWGDVSQDLTTSLLPDGAGRENGRVVRGCL